MNKDKINKHFWIKVSELCDLGLVRIDNIIKCLKILDNGHYLLEDDDMDILRVRFEDIRYLARMMIEND